MDVANLKMNGQKSKFMKCKPLMTKSHFQCFQQHVAHIKNNMYSDYVATNFAMTYE
jgi:hypothetical protein